jgi:hypothetical protein
MATQPDHTTARELHEHARIPSMRAFLYFTVLVVAAAWVWDGGGEAGVGAAPPAAGDLRLTGAGHLPASPLASPAEDLDVHYARLSRLLANGTAKARGHAAAEVDDEALTAVVRRVCVTCHSDQLLTANLSLQHFDVGRAADDPEVTERVISKLRLEMMPPPGIPRPGADTLMILAETLERRIEELVARSPNPGLRLPQRLNQAEYERSIRDLLAVQVDASAYLPPETISDSFDNISDVQSISPALLDGYMRAAAYVARAAVGEPGAAPVQVTYRVPQTTNQREQVEGAPYGSRGGISVVHNFLADGEYIFRLELHAETEGNLFGRHARGEQIEISVNGERVALKPVDRWMWERDPEGLTMTTEPIFVRAGPHRISAVFLPTSEGPINDLMSPIEHTLADLWIARDLGITTVPHLRDLRIDGPYNPTGVSDTPSRARIFTCRPRNPSEEVSCAREILSRLATEAYRRPVLDRDLDGLMRLYREAADRDGFEEGIRNGIQAILSSPHFILRLDRQPPDVRPGELYRVSDVSLASRLSFFLWATHPDEELLELARENRLRDEEVLRAQVQRMLRDPRAESLATRFAAQWLRLPRLAVHRPDAVRYPEWDDRLREAVRRETELFFFNLVLEDRSLMEMFSAEYTFVNERLARHYGIPGIVGNGFRRVSVDDPHRRGLGVLGHASILALSSHANRTSPVDRGLWVMEVLLGTEPPPPPPNVPDLDVTADVDETTGRALTVRERLEMHRSNPTCNACHQFIDPLGLPLESWGPTGLRRIRDGGNPLDTKGQLWNGRTLETTRDLREALLDMEVPVVRNFTESLLRYGLGRRVHYFDQPTVRRIAMDAKEADYRLSAFIMGVVFSDPFQLRIAEPLADDSSLD